MINGKMVVERYRVPYGGRTRVDIYADAMSRMYGLVALGIAVIAAAAWVGDAVGFNEFILRSRDIFDFGPIGALLLGGAVCGALFAARAAARRGALGLATALYIAFAGLEGLFLSAILALFIGWTQIGLAFILTAGIFAAMSVVGMRTKRGISKLAPILTIGLAGVIAISLINIFLINPNWALLLINAVVLPSFLALTVWETKQVKEFAQESDCRILGRRDDVTAAHAAVMGVIGLNFNALNVLGLLMFPMLLIIGFALEW